MRVALFTTCVVDLFEPDVGVAAVQVLRAAGCDVSCPSGQTCCGQPAWNAGFAEDAAAVARGTLDALADEPADAVVVPAGSCATMVRVFWPELFEVVGDHQRADKARQLGSRLFELTEFVDEHRPALRADRHDTVAYHHSCHMLRELGLKEPPVRLLDAIGCERVAWSADERCCGFGGLFSFKLPETSIAMADDKLDSLDGTHAATIVGSDTSCLLHLRGRAEHEGRRVEVRHIALLLAAALESTETHRG
jgi:L-lactate dehydrogenase complex protein LldE